MENKGDMTDWLIQREDSIGYNKEKEELVKKIINEINKLDPYSEKTTIILNFIYKLLIFDKLGGKNE